MTDFSFERELCGAVIGAAIACREEVIADLETWFRSDWIEDSFYRELYRGVILAHRQQAPIEPKTLVLQLKKRLKTHDKWMQRTASVIEDFSNPAWGYWHARYYASQIYDKRLREKLAIELDKISNEVMEDDSVDVHARLEYLESLKNKYKPPPRRQKVDKRAAVMAALESLEGEGDSFSFESGIKSMDAALQIKPGSLTTVAARTGQGKSSFLQWYALRHAITKGNVLFVALEMTQTEVLKRMLKTLSYYRQSVALAANDLEKANIEFFTDDDLEGITRAILAYATHTTGELLVCVDYVQLVSSGETSRTRTEEIGKVTRRLKKLASQWGIGIMQASQLNRQATGDARPRLKDLRESGSIEQDSDNVVLLYAPEETAAQPVTEVEAIIGKCRNGSMGIVDLVWEKAQYRYSQAGAKTQKEMEI